MEQWKITLAEGITSVTTISTAERAAFLFLVGVPSMGKKSLAIKSKDADTGEEVYSAIASHIDTLSTDFKRFASDNNKKKFYIVFGSTEGVEEFKNNIAAVRKEAQAYLDKGGEEEEDDDDEDDSGENDGDSDEGSGIDITEIILVAALAALVGYLIYSE